MAQLSVADYVLPTLLHQEWDALLMLGYLWDVGNTVSKKSQVCKKMKHLMAECLDEFQGDVSVDDLQGFWRGRELASLSDEEKQEILWELAEMGFHLEVYALHHCTASLDIDDEQCRRITPKILLQNLILLHMLEVQKCIVELMLSFK